MSTAHYTGPRAIPRSRTFPIVRRAEVFCILSVALLLLQYPLGRLHAPPEWIGVSLLGLIHCVVMLVDSLCVLFLHRRARATSTLVSYLIPAERRGIAQVLTLLTLIATVWAAIELHNIAH